LGKVLFRMAQGDASPTRSSPRRDQWATVLVLAATGLAATVFLLLNPSPGAGRHSVAGGGATAGPALTRFLGKRFGAVQAKVQVLAFLPVTAGCQDDVGLYLVGAAGKNGSQLSVQLYDMRSEAGQRLMHEHGVKCASVVINGRTRFDLGGEDGKVLLEGPMDLEEVRRSLLAELKSAYGEAAPTLDPVPAVPDKDKTKRMTSP